MSLLDLPAGRGRRRPTPSASYKDSVLYRWAFRPNLETLEDRLPAGDLLGMLTLNIGRFVDLGDITGVGLLSGPPAQTTWGNFGKTVIGDFRHVRRLTRAPEPLHRRQAVRQKLRVIVERFDDG